GDVRPLIIRVADATDRPLAGYNLQIVVGDAGRYAVAPGPAPAARHGRTTPSPLPANEIWRATNANGIVNLTFTAPAVPAAGPEVVDAMRVVYQPDFDTDASFAPPGPGDDRET